MRSEPLGESEAIEETLHDEQPVKLVGCPNCGDRVPASPYCLKCGYPLYNVMDGEGEEIVGDADPGPFDLGPLRKIFEEAEDPPTTVVDFTPSIEPEEDEVPEESEYDLAAETEESVEAHELSQPAWEEDGEMDEPEEMEDAEILVDEGPLTGEEAAQDELKPVEPEEPQILEEDEESAEGPSIEGLADEVLGMESDFEPDPAASELMRELTKSISLQLWAVNLLREGGIKEDHFNRLFREYKAQLERCLSQREKLLGQVQDMKPIEVMLDEARVGLGELEVRKSLGDLHPGEYEAKAPGYQWDIRNCEEEIARRNEEIAFLKEPLNTVPADEMSKMRKTAEESLAELDSLIKSECISSETADDVKASLGEILNLFEEAE
jgi:hypothetical protein